MSIEIAEIPVAPSTTEQEFPSPRQVWRIQVTPQSAKMKDGQNRGVISLGAVRDGQVVKTVTVPATVKLEVPVTVVPSEFFFSQLSPQAAISQKVVFRLADGVLKDGTTPSVEHDLGDRLASKWKPISKNYAELEVTLNVDETTEFVEGAVVVTFPEGKVAPIRVPLRAKVRKSR